MVPNFGNVESWKTLEPFINMGIAQPYLSITLWLIILTCDSWVTGVVGGDSSVDGSWWGDATAPSSSSSSPLSILFTCTYWTASQRSVRSLRKSSAASPRECSLCQEGSLQEGWPLWSPGTHCLSNRCTLRPALRTLHTKMPLKSMGVHVLFI